MHPHSSNIYTSRVSLKQGLPLQKTIIECLEDLASVSITSITCEYARLCWFQGQCQTRSRSRSVKGQGLSVMAVMKGRSYYFHGL